MANEKISLLNGGVKLTAPAKNDLLPITDVSDTTEAASGTTKPIDREVLVGRTIRTISSNDTAVETDDVVFLNTASGTVTLATMSATSRIVDNHCRPLTIKNIGTAGNSGFVNPNGSETLDGDAANYELVDGDSITIIPRTTSAWETYK